MREAYISVTSVQSLPQNIEDDLGGKVNDLNSTDDRKSRQKTHSSSNSGQHIYKFGCPVLFDFIKGGGFKVNPDISQFQFRIILLKSLCCIYKG